MFLYIESGLGSWCLTPLSTIFQLYHGGIYIESEKRWYYFTLPNISKTHGQDKIVDIKHFK